MINYAETKVGDILRITGAGAPGFANIGDLVRVTKVAPNRVDTERRDGATAYFALACGAARLEPTEYKHDFPS